MKEELQKCEQKYEKYLDFNIMFLVLRILKCTSFTYNCCKCKPKLCNNKQPYVDQFRSLK